MKAKLMRHKAFLEFAALLVVLLQTVHGREWLGELADGHVLEQHSKGPQQQQQHQQESVFWQRRVQQLDPGALSRAGRSTNPPLVPPVPAAGGSGEPGDMHMQLLQLAGTVMMVIRQSCKQQRQRDSSRSTSALKSQQCTQYCNCI
jgi:hypothetical protein